MIDLPTYPSPEEDAGKVNDWLSGADDILECANPDVNLSAVLEHVVLIAMAHLDAEVRCDALRVLRHGLIKHSVPRLKLQTIADRLDQLGGEEVSLAINVIGLSGDRALAPSVLPFLKHPDAYIRAEASDCLTELAPINL